MKQWGGTLFFFGVGSMVLSFLGLQFVILAWIDLWGPTVGWAIRIGLALVGGLMWLASRHPGAAPAPPQNSAGT